MKVTKPIATVALLPARALLTAAQRLPKRGDPKRIYMHIPVGIINALVLLVSPPLAAFMFAGFHSYQWIEEWRLNDHSYQDIHGHNIGLSVGAGILAVVALFTNYWESIPL